MPNRLLFLPIVVATWSISCSSLSAKSTAAINPLAGMSDSLAEVEAILEKPLTATQLAMSNKMTFASYFEGLAAATNNEPLRVGDLVISNVQKSLLEALPLFVQLDAKFASVGNFVRTSAIGSRAYTRGEIDATLSDLAKDYSNSSGLFAPRLLTRAEFSRTAASESVVTFSNKAQNLRNLTALTAIAAASYALDSAAKSGTSLGLITNPSASCNQPAVVETRMDTPEGDGESCTATFISSSIAITAAHCNNGLPPFYFDSSGNKVYGQYIKANPAYGSMESTNPNDDQARLQFPADPTRAVAKVASHPPSAGETVTIVGAGCLQDDEDCVSPNVINCGTNVIQPGAVEDGLIAISDADGSVSAPGDSGGPMFNSAGELVGTDSNIYYTDATTGISQQYYGP